MCTAGFCGPNPAISLRPATRILVALLAFAVSGAGMAGPSQPARSTTTGFNISVTIHPQARLEAPSGMLDLSEPVSSAAASRLCVNSAASGRYSVIASAQGSDGDFALRRADGRQVRYRVLYDGEPLAPPADHSAGAPLASCTSLATELSIELDTELQDDVTLEYRDVLTLTLAPS